MEVQTLPELPEVETIRRDLEKTVVGLKIDSIDIFDDKKIRNNDAEEFRQGIVGSHIKSVGRRAKVFLIALSNGNTLLIHLKISGQLVLRNEGGPSDRFNRLIFHLDGKELRFNDMRRFGFLKVIPTKERDSAPELADFGIEPLESDFTYHKFEELIAGKKTRIKPLLMDQSLIVGIGNLYADEILFLSGVRPTRQTTSLTEDELKSIYGNIGGVLNEAIEHRGSSVDQYVDIEGKRGGHVPFIKVYRRTGEPCFVCGTPIERVKIGSRSAHYCPVDQR